MVARSAALLSWLRGDVELPLTPRWKRARVAAQITSLAVALFVGARLTHEVRTTPAPAPLSARVEPRFGLRLETRKELFAQMAGDEPKAREEAAKKFPNDPWSIEDERAAHERDAARGLADERHLPVSTIYLILDEGIRAHWPAPNHKPLDASVVPLKPRAR